MVKGKKDKKVIILVVLLFVIAVLLTILSLSIDKDQRLLLFEKQIETSVEISQRIGFNVDNSSLVFGKVPISASSYRSLNLSNNYSFPILIEFNLEGNISDFLVYDSVVYLESGEKKVIGIRTINIPENTTYDNYTGVFTIRFYKA